MASMDQDIIENQGIGDTPGRMVDPIELLEERTLMPPLRSKTEED